MLMVMMGHWTFLAPKVSSILQRGTRVGIFAVLNLDQANDTTSIRGQDTKIETGENTDNHQPCKQSSH